MSTTVKYSEYDHFARMYNESWGPRYCKENLYFIEKLLLQHLPTNAHIIDLCCGTGQLVKELQNKGFKTIGIDASEAMLNYARQNSPISKFICIDARYFDLPSQFHAIVSTSGSLNHFMNIEDLTLVFKNVYKSLLQDSLFIIDMNLEAAFELSFRNSIDGGDVKEDYAWASRSSYDSDDKIGNIHMTLFALIKNSWQRFGTTWQVRGYSQTEIKSTLEKVGFTDISIYDAEQDFGLSGGLGKTFFVCRKK